MLSFGQQIKIARLRKEFSPAQLGAAAGVSVSTVQKIEGDKDGPGASAKLKLARFLGVPFDIEREIQKKVSRIISKPVPMEMIPQWECAIAAGSWVECTDIAAFDTDSAEYRAILKQGLFRIRIAGDSMENVWHDGSWVEFHRLRLDDGGFVKGEDYYVHRVDGTATFKRFVSSDDDQYTFRAINRKKYHTDLVVSRQELALAALAVGIFVPKKKS